jgi:hypothetical protein
VVQQEGYSDIEQKVTNYAKLMQDLDKTELFNAIKEMRNKRNMQPNINNQSIYK